MENNTTSNPFPGLRPFEEDEEHLFFGREKSVTDLLSRLRASRFLAVIGESGSGKSSLVKAGILPSLYRGFMAGVDSSWRIALFRPADDPIASLAEALTKALILNQEGDHEDEEYSDRENIQCRLNEAILRRSDRGLIDIVKDSRLPTHEKLLLVVDQFEELFRFGKLDGSLREERPESTAFVNLLLESFQQTEVPIYIVLTMRSDFLGDCTAFRGLPEAINSGQYLIPRMTREQKRAAITGPVAVGDAEITPPLLARLLNDVGNNADQLPILQHALMRTWEHWTKNRKPGEPLDIHHYEDVGGMEEALSQHAEEAYSELKTQQDRIICEKMFKLLTDTGKTGRAMRRPAKVNEICRVAGASVKEVINVINAFRQPGRTFLMPPGNIELNDDSVIDISHESLMRIWTRLIQWVKEEAESSELYIRLAKAATLHREGKAALWRDPDLMLASKWKEQTNPNSAWAQRYDVYFDDAMKFLDASKEQQERDIAEKEKAQKEKARRKRMAAMALVVSIACVISIFLTIWALNSKRDADRRRVEAEGAREDAKNAEKQAIAEKNKATKAQKEADKNAEIADTARKNALQKKEEAEEAKDKAEISRQKAEKEERKARINEMIAKIQGYIVEMNQAEDNYLQYLAKANELAVHSLALSENKELKVKLALTAYTLNFLAYNKLDTATDDTHRKLESMKLLDNPEISSKTKDFNKKYKELQNKANNQQVPAKIFEALRDAYIVAMGAEEDILAEAESWALAVIDTGKIVFNNSEGRLKMASLQMNEQKLPGIKETINLAKHSPLHVSCLLKNRHRLFCGTREGNLLSWNINTLEETKLPCRHKAKIQSIAFAPHTDTLLYSIKNAVYTYDFRMKPHLLFQVDESYYIRALAVINTSGNSILLTADEGGNIAFYDLVKKGEKNHLYANNKSAEFYAMVYSQTSKSLAASDSNGNVILFQSIDEESLHAGKELKPQILPKEHKGIVYTIAMSPDGKYLASAGWDHKLVLWDLTENKQAPLLSIQNRSKVLSLTFDSKGEYLIFSDEENLRICPTSPGVFYNILTKTKKDSLTSEEWNTYVGDSIEQEKLK